MPYTNNTPQGNQKISSTQVPILGNFTFLPISIGTEHNFNAAGTGNDTYHLQASMPNKVDPVALPAGTNGQYYISGGLPKFYNTTAQFIQLGPINQRIVTGTVNLNSSTATTFFTAPPSSCGNYYLIPPGAGNAVAMGQFVSNTLVAIVGAVSDPNLEVDNTNLNIQAQLNSGSGTFKFVVVYYTP